MSNIICPRPTSSTSDRLGHRRAFTPVGASLVLSSNAIAATKDGSSGPRGPIAERLGYGVFVASVYVSATLMFLLQPIIARILLPRFGGSPAVWNTAVVTFQLLLLGGYLYADVGVRRLGTRGVMWLHSMVVLASLVFLPRLTDPPVSGTGSPMSAAALLLLVTVGVPFFVLSTNSSLTQRWFAMARYRSSADPYWLYAASNAGSLGALIAYPFIVEPLFGVHMQLRLWEVAYVAFAVLSLATIVVSNRRRDRVVNTGNASEATAAIAHHSAPVTGQRRVGWMLRSAVASSLLLSVTTQMTTDVIAAPLLWVLPLALYLLTFIIAFSTHERVRRSSLVYACTLGIPLCFVILVVPTLLPLWFAFATLLTTLFAGALLCHTDVAKSRPDAHDLTEFYLWIAVGGAIGGVLNSIVAPLTFNTIVEFPVTLVALALCAEWRNDAPKLSPTWRAVLTGPVQLTMILATLIAVVFVILSRRSAAAATDAVLLRWQFMPLAILVAGVLFRRERAVFPLGIALVAAFVLGGFHYTDRVIDEGRSFFGVSRVTENATERVLVHGGTTHGAQRLSPGLRDIPTSYYYPRGPLGWAIAQAPPDAVIGVVGLGAGSLATLARSGQTLTFFEIDRLVVDMARRDFTYLADSPARISVEVGDGRLLLASRADAQFDVLVIDAFSGDAIPSHLLTTEALTGYLRILKPDGLLVVHVSNRFADLTRVFRGWAALTGMRVAVNEFTPTASEERAGVRATVAVAMSRSPRGLLGLARTRQWKWLGDEGSAVTWTDDHANLLAVLNRNILLP